MSFFASEYFLENRKYGSGYPGYPIGVAGYGFPFFFWPLAFGGGALYGAHYVNDNEVSVPCLLPVSLPQFVNADDVSLVWQSRQLESARGSYGYLDVRIEHSKHDILPSHRQRNGNHYGLDPPAELLVGLEYGSLQHACTLQH